jgi:hypothetical protein
MKNKTCCKFRFLIPLIVLGMAALFSFVVYKLWNGVLADVLDVKIITYWQALGLLVLARILFGGLPCRRGGPFGPFWRRRMMMEHWQSLTPEQREEMRRRFKGGPMHSCGDSDQTETKTAEDAPKA